jgi:hypothetical protein
MYYRAQKTYDAINAAIEADSGNSFRQWEGIILPHITDAYRVDDMPFRHHLGASTIGSKCGRAIWYSFHWTTRPAFSGRMLRLFNRGHLEEGRFIAMLQMINVQVFQQDANGKQFRISDCAGHYGGSGDGVGLGIPDLNAGQYALLEFKTHGDKSFVSLTAKGVKESKPEHYVQMNQYMGKMGYGCALYGAVNKNTDELHLELVAFDKPNYEQHLDRAHKIVWMKTPPTKINESPGWFECRFCDHRDVCHMDAAPDRNCRTCGYSEPIDDGVNGGSWHCSKHNAIIPKNSQHLGCDFYQRGY